jgi:valyl-tRNA synthetase
MNVPAGALVPLMVSGASAATLGRFKTHDAALKRLARLETIDMVAAPPKGAVQIVAGEAVASLPLAGIIDLAAERARLAKEMDKAQKEIAKIDAKLGNAQFMAKAPEEVVEEQRERRVEAEDLRARTEAALKRLEHA